MNTLVAIEERRAIRSYKPDPVPEATVRRLLEAAVRAPTAVHAEPWAFVVIQDRALLKKLSDLAKATWSPARDGSHAVAAPRQPSEDRARAMLLAPEFNIFYDAGTLVAICSHARNGFASADCWLAVENLMLAARALGLGTCPIGFPVPVLNRPEVKTELRIPAEVAVVAPIIVGVPHEWTPPTTRKAPEVLCWHRG
jgi:nitroreductase